MAKPIVEDEIHGRSTFPRTPMMPLLPKVEAERWRKMEKLVVSIRAVAQGAREADCGLDDGRRRERVGERRVPLSKKKKKKLDVLKQLKELCE